MEQSKNYNPKEAEPRLVRFWQEKGIFKFDPKIKKPIFSVDTPPPTVSGAMHIGHSFSYSQQDFIVRYHRMKGENVFFPFGTDDNGLPTERLVEKIKNVKSTNMKRNEFVKLCNETLREIKPNFVQDWIDIGMSCDFSGSYSTIDKHCQHTSQKSFVELYNKGLVYLKEAPSMWCTQCQTAIAQAELEDKELDSIFNDIVFELIDGEKITIATTRPELLPACVCIYVHPDDKKNNYLVGKKVRVPLFGQEVEVFADESADPEKGSGILMICSYGDKYDVEAITKRKLKPRICITKDGNMNELAGEYKGLTIKDARKKILEDLEAQGLLLAKKHIKHHVNVHDRCGTEIEFLSTQQWFIKILENKNKFIQAGEKINWYPKSMFLRYKNWIEGLQWDWCISRQRHFGVPFPVWRCKKCSRIIVAEESELPVDPLVDKPKKKCSCGSSEFEGEKDVMDTWATSSLTPQIILNWIKNKDFAYDSNIKMYPCSLRPQAHDLIRTWAFYTIVKGLYHLNEIPCKNIAISGHVLDPKGEAMHKSKGNTIEPAKAIEKYCVDALRFWAASVRLGEDLPYLEKDLATGQRTITKLWNAANFTLMHLQNYKESKVKLSGFDKYIISKLNSLIKISTESFDNYEYSKSKLETEHFFWKYFCDNYLEICKDRIYNPDIRGVEGKTQAQYVLYHSLLTILKLFAPIMPFITEEIYQKYYAKKEDKISIHISDWPKYNEKLIDEEIEKKGDMALEIIALVRKFKSERKLSMKAELKKVIVHCPLDIEDFKQDLIATIKVKEFVLKKSEALKVDIEQ